MNIPRNFALRSVFKPLRSNYRIQHINCVDVLSSSQLERLDKVGKLFTTVKGSDQQDPLSILFCFVLDNICFSLFLTIKLHIHFKPVLR